MAFQSGQIESKDFGNFDRNGATIYQIESQIKIYESQNSFSLRLTKKQSAVLSGVYLA